jgi:hypothetical protein
MKSHSCETDEAQIYKFFKNNYCGKNRRIGSNTIRLKVDSLTVLFQTTNRKQYYKAESSIAFVIDPNEVDRW